MEALEQLLSLRLRVGRLLGVELFIHWSLFVAVAVLCWTLRADPRLAALVVGVLLASTLAHELGHCLTARALGGSAREMVLWPLGGLAMVQAPMAPRPQLLVAAAGPVVNLAIALAALGPYSLLGGGWDWLAMEPAGGPRPLAVVLGVNAALAFFNLIPAWPMDGGRVLQAALWPRLGFHRALHGALAAAIGCSALLVVYAVATWPRPLLLGVALLIVASALQERERLRWGAYDEQLTPPWAVGHGALEPYAAAPAPGPIARWREARRRRREEADARARADVRERLDGVLEKVSAVGLDGLSRDERRFLDHASRLLRDEQRQQQRA